MHRLIAVFIAFLFSSAAQAQLNEQELRYFNSVQDTLSHLIRLSVKAREDAEKLEINSRFLKLVDETLNNDKSFAFPFDSLKKFKMLIISPDNELRLLTWNVPMEDQTQRFYGYVQHLNTDIKKWELFRLEDHSDEIKKPENASLTADKWFGCYYYKIVEKVYKKKKYYTLLGWDGNDRITQRKIIELLYFNSSGEPQFGDTVFEVHKPTGKTDKEIVVWQKRVIFELKQGVTMALKYDESSGCIVFDHLSPEDSSQKGQYQYYGPDLSLDAYKFKKGKWQYVKDAEAHNKKNKLDKLYNNPTKDPNSPPQK